MRLRPARPDKKELFLQLAKNTETTARAAAIAASGNKSPPLPRLATEEPEIGVEAITGWRSWHAYEESLVEEVLADLLRRREFPETPPKLKRFTLSSGNSSTWPGKRVRMEAVCSRDWPHIAPDPDCCCGIYAYKEPRFDGTYGFILGKVHLWGRLVEAQHGYRAQYAYPAELWAPMLTAVGRDMLADEYGVPVHAEARPVEYGPGLPPNHAASYGIYASGARFVRATAMF